MEHFFKKIFKNLLTRNKIGAIIILRGTKTERLLKGRCKMRIDPRKFELCLARACMSETDLRTGTSPQTLLRIRKGMEVKPKTVGKIALALGVDVIDIIENTAATVGNDK